MNKELLQKTAQQMVASGRGIPDYTGKTHRSLCAPIVKKTGQATVKVTQASEKRKRGENKDI